MMRAVDTAASSLLNDEGHDTSFTPLEPSVEDLIGSYAYRLIMRTLFKIRQEVSLR